MMDKPTPGDHRELIITKGQCVYIQISVYHAPYGKDIDHTLADRLND